MKIALHDISMVGQVDSESVKLRVEYTPEGGDTTVDYGRYNVAQNIYRPAIDEDEHEEEFLALQERVEAR